MLAEASFGVANSFANVSRLASAARELVNDTRLEVDGNAILEVEK